MEVCTILHQEHCLLLNSYIWMVSEPRADWLSTSSVGWSVEVTSLSPVSPSTFYQYHWTYAVRVCSLIFCPWVPYTIQSIGNGDRQTDGKSSSAVLSQLHLKHHYHWPNITFCKGSYSNGLHTWFCRMAQNFTETQKVT